VPLGRRSLLRDHKPLGLAYTLYADADYRFSTS